jgi:hypothetical protein
MHQNSIHLNMQHEDYVQTFCVLFIKEGKESGGLRTDTSHYV